MSIIIILVVVVILFSIIYFNRFIKLKNKSEDAWSGIDVQLQRRYDLIPNLLETIKGYASHEKDIIEKITSSRAQAMGSGSRTSKAASENMLTESLKSLFALAENYPDLKANSNFQKFQEQLSEIEDKLQMARRYYNGAVRENNNAVETFPGNILAGVFGFSPLDFFESEPEAVDNVKVKF